LMSAARILSTGVDREIIGEIERMQALAASPSLRQGDFAEFQRQAEDSLVLRQSGNIMLIDRDMRQLVNTWMPFGRHLPKTAAPESAQRALTTGKPQITGLFTGSIVKQLVFAIVVPVQIDGQNRYALARSPNQHALAGLIAAQELPPGWLAVISDAAHRIIVRSDQQDAFIGQELPAAQRHGAGLGDVFEFTDSEGRRSLEANSWSKLTDWQTSVWAPKAMLEAPVRALWWTIGLTALTAFALVLALASWLGRIIAHSVGHAARTAIALGKGDPPPLSETPVAEVNMLMAELRGATDLLRESAAKFRAMFDVSSVGKMEVDPGTARILRANAAMCKFVGYSEAELLARTVLDITHPDDRNRFLALLTSLKPGQKFDDVEVRTLSKTGKVFIMEGSASKGWLNEDLFYTRVIFHDVTDRKKSEQMIKEQNVDLAEKNKQINDGLVKLRKASASRKSTAIAFGIGVALFLISEFWLEPTFIKYSGNANYLWMFKTIIVVLLKPIDMFLERWMLRQKIKEAGLG